MFNLTLEEVFNMVGGRDHDQDGKGGKGGCCGCCSSWCTCCCTKPVAVTADEDSPLNLEEARNAVAELIRSTETATFFAQVSAVVAKNITTMLRGSWKSLLLIVCVAVAPAIVLTHLFGSRDQSSGVLQSMFLLVGFGVGTSLMLPWLVVVAVKDNGEGILELVRVSIIHPNQHTYHSCGSHRWGYASRKMPCIPWLARSIVWICVLHQCHHLRGQRN